MEKKSFLDNAKLSWFSDCSRDISDTSNDSISVYESVFKKSSENFFLISSFDVTIEVLSSRYSYSYKYLTFAFSGTFFVSLLIYLIRRFHM
ncbi:unnamed protein product [Pneumocystis jirovecii]|uniref:Uncharacterized protein n=1 Tax=Pneumocystis jirovecii TaxID=42068 RepID=L0PED3_PNEJI|nr:unnamed protein product [Pneumocystis jirovecii]